jgi:hypothetical protein
MEGIVLLNKITVYDTSWGFSPEGCVLLIMALILAILVVVCIYFDMENLACLFVTFALFSIAVGAWMFSDAEKNPIATQYEVYLTEDVNIEDFAQKYNIIKQDGVIFTIEEKETP